MQVVRELRSLIYGRYDSQSDCANALGWSREKLSRISRGQKEPDITECNELAQVLGITAGEITEIFLRNKSPNEQHESFDRELGGEAG